MNAPAIKHDVHYTGPPRVLISWIGRSDLCAAQKDFKGDNEADMGPVLRLLRHVSLPFQRVYLLNDIADDKVRADRELPPTEYYAALGKELKERSRPAEIIDRYALKNLRTDYRRAYTFTRDQIGSIRELELARDPDTRFGLLVTPGYFSVQTAMLLASQKIPRDRVEIYDCIYSREAPVDDDNFVRRVDLPYELAVDVATAAPTALESLREQIEQAELGEKYAHVASEFLGESPAMDLARIRAVLFSQSDTSLILVGETGTGKSKLARCIHDLSNRRDKQIVEVPAGSLDGEIINSLLFGHVKGAFTGADKDHKGFIEAANGSTLFIDDIGGLPRTTMNRLLTALQEKRFQRLGSSEYVESDFRLIVATNLDLEAFKQQGDQADRGFFYRVVQNSIEIPPLRHRRGDIGPLATEFLARGERNKTLTPRAIENLKSKHWEGNVRELEATMKRVADLLPAKTVIDLPDLVEHGYLDVAVNHDAPSLRSLTKTEFFQELAAVCEELVVRLAEARGFPDKGRETPLLQADDALPLTLDPADDVVSALVRPLLRGRIEARFGKSAKNSKAHVLAGDKARSLDEKGAWSDTYDQYRHTIAPYLDESVIHSRRGVSS